MDSEELNQVSIRQPDSKLLKNAPQHPEDRSASDTHFSNDLRSGRSKFEQYLHDQPQKELWTLYLRLKAEAKERKKDPIDYLFEKLEQNPNTAKRVPFLRMKYIGRRVITATERDVIYLKNILEKSGVSLEELCTVLNDRKRIADLIVALKLDKLSGVESDSIYFTVDKLVTTAEHKGVSAPIGGQIQRAFREKKVLEKALGDQEVLGLLFGFKSEEYLSRFQKDFSQAEKDLQAEIAVAGTNERVLLEKVLSYYRTLKDYSIPGIVASIEDKETNEVIPFPALHQKIFAQFLLDKQRVALFDDMGLGKTASSIIAKNALEQKLGRKLTAVVIAPNEQVADHWEEEIKKWNIQEKSTVRIKAENKEAQLARIKKGETDFVVTTYDLIFRAVNGSTVGDKLKEFAEYAIFDEAHKAKEESAKRTIQVLSISSNSDYVVLMSGTPIPNRLDDSGVIASILKKGTPDEIAPKEFCSRYRKNPRVVRTMLLPHMLRRLNETVYGARDEELIFVPVPMSEKQTQAHLDTDMNQAGFGALQLIQQLRRCSLDPRLVGVDEPSPKYETLKDLVVGEVEQGRKVLIYSSELKEGVLDKVAEVLRSNNEMERVLDGIGVKSEKIEILNGRRFILPLVKNGRVSWSSITPDEKVAYAIAHYFHYNHKLSELPYDVRKFLKANPEEMKQVLEGIGRKRTRTETRNGNEFVLSLDTRERVDWKNTPFDIRVSYAIAYCIENKCGISNLPDALRKNLTREQRHKIKRELSRSEESDQLSRLADVLEKF